MRLTELRRRLDETFGPAYAASVAHDQVLPELDGRTIEQALAEGMDIAAVWRGVVAAFPDRVPARVR
jgi:hypothetical protein